MIGDDFFFGNWNRNKTLDNHLFIIAMKLTEENKENIKSQDARF